MTNQSRSSVFSLFTSAHAWFICGIAMLFYCFNYFLRVSPSVMQPELSEAFHINAYQFGSLAALYYWAYTPMQIPAGMVYDKFGARFVLAAACLTAVTGLAIFIAADNYFIAGSGRFIIGLGCAFAYIGILKLASVWLPSNRFATVAGLTTALGMCFGALSQKYLANIVHAVGYKDALETAIFIGIGLSLLIITMVRSRPKQPLVTAIDQTVSEPKTLTQLIVEAFKILLQPQMLIIGAIGCLLYLPASVFLDLWGIRYLETVYNISANQAVNISSCLFLGWVVGGPIIGAYSDYIKRRRTPLIIFSSISALLFFGIFYGPTLSINQLYIAFFLTGFTGGAQPLCFPLGKENHPIRLAGTAVAVTNMMTMIGGMVFQPLVGKLLDMHSTSPLAANGLPVHTGSDFTFALSVVPIGVALAVILAFFVKETYCQSHPEEKSELAQDAKLAVEAEG